MVSMFAGILRPPSGKFCCHRVIWQPAGFIVPRTPILVKYTLHIQKQKMGGRLASPPRLEREAGPDAYEKPTFFVPSHGPDQVAVARLHGHTALVGYPRRNRYVTGAPTGADYKGL